MILYCFILFFLSNYLSLTENKDEYIPALIWTSDKFQNRKSVEDLVLNKIPSDEFEYFVKEILGEENPLIVVFLEQTLSLDDFEWRDENGYNAFPFLSNLSVKSRVDYFRAIEAPYQCILQLSKRGYTSMKFQPDINFENVSNVLLSSEFKKINSSRPDALRIHDENMEKVTELLEKTERNWLCIYTARHLQERDYLPEMSTWHVTEQVLDKPSKVLSFYQDPLTKLALMIRGSIQLFLPSLKNLVVKNLENHYQTSAKQWMDKVDFIIWFLNYTTTFYLEKRQNEWIIKKVKIENENGDSLNLSLRTEELVHERKCYSGGLEFQNHGKPTVKMRLLKYKFLDLQNNEECHQPLGFQMTSSVLILATVTVALFWHFLLSSCKISSKSKVVKVPFDHLIIPIFKI